MATIIENKKDGKVVSYKFCAYLGKQQDGEQVDRNDKLKTILSKADRAIGEDGDMTECVDMLRAAAQEFPTEPKVLLY